MFYFNNIVSKKLITRATIVLVAFITAMFCVSFHSEEAHAYDGIKEGSIASVSSSGYSRFPRTYYVKNVEDMNKCLKDMTSANLNKMSERHAYVDLLQDVKADRRVEFPDVGDWGADYTLNMHGHVLSRDLDAMPHKQGVSKGEVIYTNCGILEINGTSDNDPVIEHRYRIIKNGEEEFFKLDEDGDQVMTGALITGGLTNDYKSGGGITSIAYLYLNNLTIAGNVSQTYGSNFGCGGGVYGYNLKMQLNNTNISYNYAQGWGGGVFLTSVSNNFTMINNSKIEHNTSAKKGGGIAVESEGSRYGVQPHIELGSGCSISNNLTYGDGGGVFQDDYAARVRLKADSTISNNVAKGNGGGIASDSCDGFLNLEDQGSICNNHADKDGGAICYTGKIKEWTVTGEHKFENNSAGGKGGAICFHKGGTSGCQTFSSDGTMEFINNTSESCGGAIYCDYNTHLKFFDDNQKTIFKNNRAKYNGGAMAIENADDYSMHITNATFEGNSAHTGGAIWYKNDLYLKNTSITGNTATNKGGGVYCDNNAYKNFELAGKMTIFGNSIVDSNGKFVSNSNLSIRNNQTFCGGDGENVLSAESKIGVTDENRIRMRISGNAALFKEVGDNWANCVISDDPTRSVERDGDYLYLNMEPTKYQLTVNDGNGATTTQEIPNATVALNSAVHKMVKTVDGKTQNYAIDYWRVDYANGDTRIVSDIKNGMANITMGTAPTTATAHYIPVVNTFKASVVEYNQWDALVDTNDVVSVSTNKLGFGCALESGAEVSTETVANHFTKSRKVEDVKDSDGNVTSKKVTYTFVLQPKFLKSANLAFDASSIDENGVTFDTTFKSIGGAKVQSTGLVKSVDENGNVTLQYTAEILNPNVKTI